MATLNRQTRSSLASIDAQQVVQDDALLASIGAAVEEMVMLTPPSYSSLRATIRPACAS